jgi:hypothetical protein
MYIMGMELGIIGICMIAWTAYDLFKALSKQNDGCTPPK